MGNWGQKFKHYQKDSAIKLLIVFGFIFVLFCSLVLALQGSGTTGDPYLIHNWTELDSMRDDLSANYKLVGNLSSEDSDYSTYNSGSGWNPVGNDTNPFTGTFDGNGHTISYLYSLRAFKNYMGLFGYISSTSTIYNVSLIEIDVRGYYSTGGLVGYNDGGTIKDSWVSGELLGLSNVGGLVGLNFGIVNNTYATINVTGDDYVGGLVGYNDGSVLNSFSTGGVSGSGSSIRGLVGSKGASSVITYSYYNNQTSGATGTGYGEQRNTSQMTSNPYDATTYVNWDFNNVWSNNTNFIFDHVGNSGYPALIFQSSSDPILPYSSNAQVNNTKVSLPTLFSIDVVDNRPLKPNGYYIFSTNNSGSWVNDSDVNFTSVIQTISVTKTLDSTPKTVGYKWYVYDNSGNLNTYSSSIETYSISGSGTQADPYLVTNWEELYNMRNNLASYYKLIVNLSSSTTGYSTYNSGVGWEPIGINAFNPFSGTFDGDKNTISDLVINNATRVYLALFGYQASSTIKNLGVLNASVTAHDYSAILVSRGTTNISNVYATGVVNCPDGSIVGGLVAHSAGYLTNSYADVNVTGNDTGVGGLVGYLNGGTITNSYSAGNVTGESDVGGLVGTDTFGTVTSSFYDTNTSGQSDDSGKGTPRTTIQMKNETWLTLPSSDPAISFNNTDFEDGNLGNWTTGGDANWVINDTAFEGSYSGRAGTITGDQLTWINRSITLSKDTYLNFYWKVSSEGGAYDNLVFCLDNPACTRSSGFTDRIYGVGDDWALITHNLSIGTYVIHWAYGKDSSGDNGLDTGWIDNIYFTEEYYPGLKSSWDLDYIWAVDAGINNGYPYLKNNFFNITLNTPANDTTHTGLVTLNCSATSYFELENVSLSVWDSFGNLDYSNSTAISGTSNSTSFNYTFGDGTYTWNCEFSDTSNNAETSANNTFYISTISPAINLFTPSNSQYLNYDTNINFNFSAVDSEGVDVCELWGNYTGTWAKNYTFSSVTNGVEYSHVLNLSDNKYIWNMYCNDTDGNSGFFNNNYTVTIDTIDPTSSVDSISTTNNSQTISFNSSATDTNLGSCKYSIYNTTSGEIDGLNVNASISCNANPHSATVTGYANFTLRVYVADLASNEVYDELNFTTSSVDGTTIVIGGGGANGGEVEKIPTVAIIKIDESGRFSDLQRTILFARINSLCSEKKTGSTTLTIQDFSSGECSLKKSDLEILRANLALEGLSIDISDLIEFYYNFNEGELEQTFHTLDEIREYDLFTSVLGIINPMLINPPRLDRPFLISQTGGNTTIEYVFTVNKDIRDCSILSGEGFECVILTNSSVKMILYIDDTDFFDKIFQGEMSITSEADPNNLEVKRISLVPRVYNLSYPIAGIPALWILIFLGVVLLVLSIFFITRTRLQKELKRRFK